MPPTATAVIRRTTIAELRESAAELIRAHWDEVALSKDLMVLDPNWSKYELLEVGGGLVSVGAYVDDALVGYSVGLVTGHLHYKGLVYYQNDVLFVATDHRRSSVGLALIAASEEMAAAMGAKMACWHAKQNTALERLLEARRYAVQDIIYSRRI